MNHAASAATAISIFGAAALWFAIGSLQARVATRKRIEHRVLELTRDRLNVLRPSLTPAQKPERARAS